MLFNVESDDENIKKILKKINHNETKICALAERSFLKTLGGDCDTAVGCSAILKRDSIELNAQLFSDDGKKVFNVEKFGKLNEPELIGKLAGEEILKKSGNNFVKKMNIIFTRPLIDSEDFHDEFFCIRT